MFQQTQERQSTTGMNLSRRSCHSDCRQGRQRRSLTLVYVSRGLRFILFTVLTEAAKRNSRANVYSFVIPASHLSIIHKRQRKVRETIPLSFRYALVNVNGLHTLRFDQTRSLHYLRFKGLLSLCQLTRAGRQRSTGCEEYCLWPQARIIIVVKLLCYISRTRH